MKKLVVLLILAIFTLSGCQNKVVYDAKTEIENPDLGLSQVAEVVEPEVIEPVVTVLPPNEPKIEQNQVVDEPVKNDVILPKKVELEVKFASQAPLGNWSLPYQEACEEASLITAYKYFAGANLTPSSMDLAIKDLVYWEKENIGTYTDTNVDEVARIGREYFNLNLDIVDYKNIDDIKKALASGYLVLLPTAGQVLGNPNFSGAGPIYHFIVARGYDDKYIYVNDVGTRKGDNYKYKYDVIDRAIHDLPIVDNQIFRPYESVLSAEDNAKLILTGVKKIIIVKGLN